MQLLGSKRLWITPLIIYSISNGLIECFHSQVKAALKSQPDPAQWTEALPIVLLSIHIALKEDLHCTAGLWHNFETTWWIFWLDSNQPISDRASYISQFKIAMQQLRAAPDATQERPCYVILYTCLCQTWCYPEAVTAFDLWTNTCCFQCHKTFCFSEFRLYSVCVVLDLTFVALFIWITFKFDRSKMNLSNIHVANSTSTTC